MSHTTLDYPALAGPGVPDDARAKNEPDAIILQKKTPAVHQNSFFKYTVQYNISLSARTLKSLPMQCHTCHLGHYVPLRILTELDFGD
jgi:hypothetical protein